MTHLPLHGTARRLLAELKEPWRGDSTDFRDSCVEFLQEFRQNPAACSAALEHPLGFAVFRWDTSPTEALRLHIWSKADDVATSAVDHRHDHRWRLHSCILCGSLIEHELELEAVSAHEGDPNALEIAEIHQAGASDTVMATGRRVRIAADVRFTVSVGEKYSLPPGEFHWTEPGPARPVATLVAASVELDRPARTLLAPGTGGRAETGRATIDVTRTSAIVDLVLDEITRSPND